MIVIRNFEQRITQFANNCENWPLPAFTRAFDLSVNF